MTMSSCSTRPGVLTVWTLAAMLGLSSCEARRARVPLHEVTSTALLNAAADTANWLMFGGSYANTRYSGLRQITAANIGQVRVESSHEVGVSWRDRLGVGWRQGERKRWNWHPRTWGNERQVSTPLVIDQVLYYTGAYGVVVAVDAVSGVELWRYRHAMRRPPMLCCGPSNRGVAAWEDKLFLATLDARLIALNRADGRVVWDVEIASVDSGYSETMAPLVVDGIVIIGSSGAEFGIRGLVDAYDADTGRRLWRFWTIPSPEEGGWWGRWAATTPEGDRLPRDIEAERADSAKYPESWRTGGGSVWATPAYDPDLGLLYVGVGNPAPVIDDTPRPGDNLYTCSIVALDLRTGRKRWHYQFVPHDMWDTDVQAPIVLFDLPSAEGTRAALALPSETGWVYILDRKTGERIRRTEPVVPQHNMFARPSAAGTLAYPAVRGGASWAPSAYSPGSHLLFVPGQVDPVSIRVARGEYSLGKYFVGGEISDAGNAGVKRHGTLTAIDVVTGSIAWQHRTAEPLARSGVLVTAGGLLFYGDDEGYLNALDERSGKVLRRFAAGGKVEGPPITYSVNGHQRIAAVTRAGLIVLSLD
jgi:alcohol dehydrogenase (cytochrome c)